MSVSKTILAFRILFLLCLFRLQFPWRSFKSCLKQCEKNGFLSSVDDFYFADKVLRKSLSLLPFEQGCLLHSLTLAKASKTKIDIYFEVLKTEPLRAHSYVKLGDILFSTSFSCDKKSLLVWSKSVPC